MVESKETSIITVIDRLLEYVESNEFISLKEASKALALNPEQVEKLALLLEENGLMEVNYTLSGVRLAKKGKDSTKESREAVEKVNKVLKNTEELANQIIISEHLTEFVEKDLLRRFEVADKLLNDLEKNKDYSPLELKFVRREVTKIEQQLSAFQIQITKLDKREDDFKKRLDKFRDRLKHVQVRTEKHDSHFFARITRFLGIISKKKLKQEAIGQQKKQGFFSRFFNRNKSKSRIAPMQKTKKNKGGRGKKRK